LAQALSKKHTLSPTLSIIHSFATLSLSLSNSLEQGRTLELEREEWRREWRRKGRKRREASAPSYGPHQHVQSNHVELKRLALILWIFSKGLICGFW